MAGRGGDGYRVGRKEGRKEGEGGVGGGGHHKPIHRLPASGCGKLVSTRRGDARRGKARRPLACPFASASFLPLN